MVGDGSKDEMGVYKELMKFLESGRADLRNAASEAVLGVRDRDTISNLLECGIIKSLCKLGSRHENAGVNALKALVYLSSDGTTANKCIEDMIDCGAISRMSEISLSHASSESEALSSANKNASNNIIMWCKRVNYSLALLANMTRTERGAIELCGRVMPDEAIPSTTTAECLKEQPDLIEVQPSKPTISLLLSRFLSNSYLQPNDQNDDADDNDTNTESKTNSNTDSEYQEQSNDNLAENEFRTFANQHHDPFQHFAAILMNITQVEQGRKFVMKIIHPKHNSNSINKDQQKVRPTSVLQQILPHLKSTNPVRRQGIAGTIKNCCFEKDAAWWLINEVHLIKHILYPLAGPEELDLDEKQGMDPDLWLEGPDKIREPNPTTRLFLIETILLLCAAGRKSRDSLRLQRTYVIIKMADMVEESEEISEKIGDCVNFLRRDEAGMQEGASDQLIYDTYNVGKTKRLLTLPTPSPAGQISSSSSSNQDDYDDID